MTLKFQILACIFAFAVLGSESAFAFPQPRQPMTANQFLLMPPSGNLKAADFTAIIALSNCSGSLVRFENAIPSDKAIVLTNGHCLGGGGFLKTGEVKTNMAVSRSFALLKPDASRFATLNSDMVLFASMTYSDMTLYRLTETYADIKQKYGVSPLVLSPHHPAAGTPIDVVSGYWKKVYSCKIDKFIFELHEAGWTFKDSVRYSQPGCETIGGTSGSPILDANTHEVIGINNTGNENGQRCTMNNPCEVDEHGNVTVVPHASYGQETVWLYTCLDGQRSIDLNKPGCLLKP